MQKLLNLLALMLLLHPVSAQELPDTITISDNLELIRVSAHSYRHVSYTISEQWGRIAANGVLYFNGKQAVLLDTPWDEAQTENLLKFIRDSLHLELKAFIPNHGHVDCMGGLETVKRHGIPSWAEERTISYARDHGLPEAEHVFKDSLQLKIGEANIYCYYLGAAHSMDNIVCWMPDEKLLFPGCIVKELRSRSLGNTSDGDLSAYPQTLERIIARFPGAILVVPGHGAHGGADLLTHTLELANSLNTH